MNEIFGRFPGKGVATYRLKEITNYAPTTVTVIHGMFGLSFL